MILTVLGLLANAPSTYPSQPLPTTPRHPPLITCPTVARPALDLIVKNERGQVLRQLSGLDAYDHSWLKIANDGNLYTVSINRRWYQPKVVRDIKVVYDQCGPAKPTRVVIRLQPVADAPIVREFRITTIDSDNLIMAGYWPYFQRYTTFLDAPSSVSREVVWNSSHPDVATIDPSGMLRSVCNREVGRTTITAMLKADLNYTSSTVFGRGGGGMVCKRGAVDR